MVRKGKGDLISSPHTTEVQKHPILRPASQFKGRALQDPQTTEHGLGAWLGSNASCITYSFSQHFCFCVVCLQITLTINSSSRTEKDELTGKMENLVKHKQVAQSLQLNIEVVNLSM